LDTAKAGQAVVLEELPLVRTVFFGRQGGIDIEVVAPAGELHTIVAHALDERASFSSDRSAHWPVNRVTGLGMAKIEVRLAALGTSFRLVGAGPLDRDALIDFAGWAEALGVKWLRVFDGGKLADAAELAAASEAVRWWREERARRGWKTDIMVETHDSLFTAEAMGRAVEAMPGLAILWDSHHTWKKGGEDPLYTWSRMRAHVVHVHLKDSISVPSSRHPYTYVLPGTGEFPAAALVPVLREQFEGVVSLEWEKLWHPSLPPLEDALAAAAERAWW
jgi:sugar phosphate isomerase/epimerase